MIRGRMSSFSLSLSSSRRLVLLQTRIRTTSATCAATRTFSSTPPPPPPKEQPKPLLGFSTSSLGFESSFIRPVLASIRQLPEVEAAIDQFPSISTLDNLKRASDVFASFDKGGREHLAVQAMLAECQQRLALYEEAVTTIEELRHSSITSENKVAQPTYFEENTILALAKIKWTMGDFHESEKLCEEIISTYNDLEETFPSTNLHIASAMTGKALSQLVKMNSMDDAYSVRDFFRVSIKFLERHPPSGNTLPQAAVLSNGGLAEAIYNIYLEETNNVSVPISPALRFLFQGLQKTAVSESSSNIQIIAASRALEASIQSNLAWGVLNYETDRSDRLSKASDYAKKSLEFYDAESILEKEGLIWILSVVASCYHQADSAVTAEGLFKSATNKKDISPGTLTTLQLRDAYHGYSNLCKQWDNRDEDGKQLKKEAEMIESKLPPSWQGKSGIHGSLWFWTPGEFS
ncbi:MAG: hypothetical protein ACI8RD_000340 [Bacillariaceae sp.]|jgi:hypothetical protein